MLAFYPHFFDFIFLCMDTNIADYQKKWMDYVKEHIARKGVSSKLIQENGRRIFTKSPNKIAKSVVI